VKEKSGQKHQMAAEVFSNKVRFQVLTAESMKMAVFWTVAP
jgi:hypothetical protein